MISEEELKLENQRLIGHLRFVGIKDEKVLKAILEVPRHLFLPMNMWYIAYADDALPLEHKQTISQPYTVAIMIEALELKKGDKVLEVGTASGWNACLIAKIIDPGIIYTTEIIKELVEYAGKNIKRLDIKNIKITHTDGSLGYEKEAPFDKIIVTCACREIPPPLLEQLKNNGILVAPVGSKLSQQMIKITKQGKKLKKDYLGDFVFVPLLGRYGWR